jgi:hypothetical protein
MEAATKHKALSVLINHLQNRSLRKIVLDIIFVLHFSLYSLLEIFCDPVRFSQLHLG